MKYKHNFQNSVLPDIRGFIFDLDGVFYKGDEALKGGFEIVKYLKSENIPFAFFTNNSQKTPDEYVKKLAKFGLHVNAKQIMTAGVLALRYIKENFKSVKVVGSPALKELFYNFKSTNPEAIVVGMSNEITMKDLSNSRNFALSGLPFIFTNPDELIPTKNGYELECGFIINALKEHMKTYEIVGKPSIFGYELLQKYLHVEKNHLAMVGDTYQTDIKGAIEFGIIPIHLQTSNSTYNKDKLDSYEFMDLEDLLKHLKEKR